MDGFSDACRSLLYCSANHGPYNERYLVLYQYGGVYADIDSAPGQWFKNGTVISDDDDAWFIIERVGTLSQYFMTSSPKHPLMYLAVTVTLRRLLEVEIVGVQYVPYITGPGALKEAFSHFIYNPTKSDDKKEPDAEEKDVEEETGEESVNTSRRRISELGAGTQNTTSEEAVTDAVVNPAIDVPASPRSTDAPKKARHGGLEEGVYLEMLGRTVTIVGSRRVSKGRGSRNRFVASFYARVLDISHVSFDLDYPCSFFFKSCHQKRPATSTSSGNPFERAKNSITHRWE